jgi:MFS superfamily sulfate permease-like transporter
VPNQVLVLPKVQSNNKPSQEIPAASQARGAPLEATGPNAGAQPPPSLDPGLFSNLRYDAPAGLVVFLVALPLCLGIALASGAPLLSGLIAGMAGGLVIPLISRSQLSVSGPAAGLAAVVLTGIAKVGAFETFTLAVLIAGAIQIGLGALKAGVIADYMPSSVIKGMLTAIGILLILKQLPHAIGFDKENFASQSFKVGDENTFSFLVHAAQAVAPGAILLSAMSLAVLITWEKTSLKKITWLPGPLIAVVFATVGNILMTRANTSLALEREHLVTLPINQASDLWSALRLPNWSAITRGDVWVLGVTLALVASLETLLNIEAVDRLDPFGRKSPTNRELVAQGAANMVSGLVGGLPVTSVIVRSSASVNAGARTRAAAFIHGVLLLLSILFAAALLNQIPLACLAAILLMTGYKLAKPKLFAEMYKLGYAQFIPFMVTILGVVFTDLLKGVLLGLAVGLVFSLRTYAKRAFEVIEDGSTITIKIHQDAHFFTRRRLLHALEKVPQNARVIVDAQGSRTLDHDVEEALRDFTESARRNNITVEMRGVSQPPLQPAASA